MRFNRRGTIRRIMGRFSRPFQRSFAAVGEQKKVSRNADEIWSASSHPFVRFARCIRHLVCSPGASTRIAGGASCYLRIVRSAMIPRASVHPYTACLD